MLLQRDRELATLAALLDDLDGSGGRVVLVRGEAGIGKTSLVAEFVDTNHARAHVLAGACDDLLTPQPLGAFWDIGRDEPTVADPLRDGDRRGVWEAVFALLSRRLRPTILVLEDTQWADEATLDAIRFLGRRIGRANAMLILTYRDGEVDTEHPLRQLIAELPPQYLVRMALAALSAESVAAMIGDRQLGVDEVLALTGGNPLFVSEIVASGVEIVPPSVADSVLARAARLAPEAQHLLRLLSVLPGGGETWLIEMLAGADAGHLAQCVRAGLIRLGANGAEFHHELQRRAIESSLSVDERRRCNQEALAALVGRADPSRLVHHAREAGDVAAIVKWAPLAAGAAMSVESYREAAAHFRALARHLDRVPEEQLAGVLSSWARSEFYIDSSDAVDTVTRAVAQHRSTGDDHSLSEVLTLAARVFELNGRPDQADACADEAVSLLESYPQSADLAFALSQAAWLRLMRGDDDRKGVELADSAIAIAEATGDDRTVARAMVYRGAMQHSVDARRGMETVEEGHRRAAAGGHRYEEAYALLNLAGLNADARHTARAADLVQRARDTAARFEIRSLEVQAQAMYAEILLWQGRWAEAEDTAGDVLGANPHAEMIALRILGTLQARRGRAEAAMTLERVWSLAEPSGELQNLDPAAAALAEHMWLSERRDQHLVTRLERVLDQGMQSGFAWPSGAFAFWLFMLGLLEEVPQRVSSFYRWIIEGRWEAAADFWEERGAPYERGLALMNGDDEARLAAVRIFESLGAAATAGRVRRDLLDRGVKVPRGRGRSTTEHVAGLTLRQAEVLGLLAEDLSNAEIADRLFVSPRTVENHVSAILMKLDVPTRGDAVAEAERRGILES